MGARKKELVRYVTVRDEHNAPHTFGPGDTVPGWAVKKITNPGAWGEINDDEPVEDNEPEGPADDASDEGSEGDSESEGSETDDDVEDDYDAWKVQQLKDEIAARNEGREESELLSVKGKKPELIATLRADDAETDAAGE